VDSAWEKKKLEARKILENGDDSHHHDPGVRCRGSGARYVRQHPHGLTPFESSSSKRRSNASRNSEFLGSRSSIA
jgi:hypothetical protein